MTARLRLSLPSRIDAIADACAEVRRALAGHLDAAGLDAVELSTREALANAIVHGAPVGEVGGDAEVDLVLEVHADRVALSVRDRGPGFDASQVPDPRTPAGLLKSRGRGLLFMRALMDVVEHARHPEGGTVVRLVKRTARAGGGGGDMPQLSVKEKQSGNVTILGLSGKIAIGEGDVQLREAVRAALEAGRKNLVLDLGEVTYVDSSGIGELVSSYTATGNKGGRLKLLNVTRRMLDLLTITKLVTIFEIFDSEEEAVASFK